MSRVVLIVIAFLLSVNVPAAMYKGQRVFIRKCVPCHKHRLDFIKSKTIFEWEELLEKNGKPLAQIHLKNKDAQKSWDYFKGKKYPKKLRHLREFLVGYAKDSGYVPSCN